MSKIQKAIDALDGCDEYSLRHHISEVSILIEGYADSQSELAMLREELANHDSATKLINAWVDTYGKKIPWDKAIEIIAVVTKMAESERQRLLCMDDQYELVSLRLTAAEQRNAELVGLLTRTLAYYTESYFPEDLLVEVKIAIGALKPTESGASE